jgi:hypothetical protein
MTFKEKFEGLKNTNKGRLIALGLIILVNSALLTIAYIGCLIILIIPLATFGIQYFFGERELKNFIILGIIAVLLTCLVFGLLLSYQYYSYDPPALEGSSGGIKVLENGRVTPYSGDVNQEFNFTVTYNDPSGNRPNVLQVDPVSVLVNYTVTENMIEVDSADNDTSDGKAYFYESTLPEDIYYFRFISQNSAGTWTNSTGTFEDFEQGPVNLPVLQFLAVSFSYLPFFAMMYFLFIMLYWWTKRARTFPGPSAPPEPKKEDEFTCSKCEADVPGDASKCPNCGEAFEEDEDVKVVERIEKGKVFCKVCNDQIKKDDMILGCQCGRMYHLKCSRKLPRCPHCGTDFKED